jgi:hypothetical protein
LQIREDRFDSGTRLQVFSSAYMKRAALSGVRFERCFEKPFTFRPGACEFQIFSDLLTGSMRAGRCYLLAARSSDQRSLSGVR